MGAVAESDISKRETSDSVISACKWNAPAEAGVSFL